MDSVPRWNSIEKSVFKTLPIKKGKLAKYLKINRMTRESYVYKVNVRDFVGQNDVKGLEVDIKSDFELDEQDLGRKVMSVVVKEYDKLAHEFNDKTAYDKLMNIKGMKEFRKIDSSVASIEHEIVYECQSDELD